MDVKQILRDSGFRFNKQFGQNFLTDDVLLSQIAGDADCADTVLEVGAGAGTLTRVLSRFAHKVVAFEIDRNLKSVLDVTLADCPNVELVMGDVMKFSTAEIESLCGGAYSVVANIPYYITTPLLMKFIEEGKNVRSLTLTVQKEVAERLVAKPATKQYGAITVAVDSVADVKITRILPKELFYPQPNVDSAVVNIVLKRDKCPIVDAKAFRKTVKAAFAMRRKTLVNNVAVGFKTDKATAEKILKECGLASTCRGEELSTQQFVELCDCLKRYGLV